MAGCLRVTHPFATRNFTEIKFLVRLACVKHAASVRPEPGSNSPINFIEEPIRLLLSLEVASLSSLLLELSIAFHNLGMFLTVWSVINGAENGTRTRDPHLGKVVLYH